MKSAPRSVRSLVRPAAFALQHLLRRRCGTSVRGCLYVSGVVRRLFNNNFGEVKGMASIVVLSFLLLLVIVLAFCSASSSEIPVAFVLRGDDYE